MKIRLLLAAFVLLLVLCGSVFGEGVSSRGPSRSFRRSLISSLPAGIAGGVAGSTGTTLLFPLDAAKTLRQTNPKVYSSLGSSLRALLTTRANKVGVTPATLRRLYSGVGIASFWSFPSSFLYFYTYTAFKGALPLSGPLLHSVSAASGNAVSSIIFVPKEMIKQRSQMTGMKVRECISTIFRDKGLKGFYVSYVPTLFRNVPSAVLRFTIYESLRSNIEAVKSIGVDAGDDRGGSGGVMFAVAGGVAGSAASLLTTPLDVLKTRMNTGDFSGVVQCAKYVARNDGMKGLFAGAGARAGWSCAFSAVGFGVFEAVKSALENGSENRNFGRVGVGDGDGVGGNCNCIGGRCELKKLR